MTAAVATRKSHAPPPAIANQLAMLRESCLHAKSSQDWLARWWKGLLPADRRTLLAWSGLDDSEAFALRPWEQMQQSDRDSLLMECKRLGKLVKTLEWI